MDKLTIGILIQDDFIAEWQHKVIQEILDNEKCEIALLIKKNGLSELAKKDSQSKNISASKKMYSLFTKYDIKSNKSKYDAFKSIRIQDISSAHKMTIQPTFEDGYDVFDQKDIDTISSAKIDLLIQFGFNKLKGEISRITKFGIWQIIGADVKVDNGGPDGFWEVMNKSDTLGVTLQMLQNDDLKTISTSLMVTDKISVRRNINSNYQKAIALIPRAINEILKEGLDHFGKIIEQKNIHPNFKYSPVLGYPRNSKMILLWTDFYWRRVKNKIKSYFYLEQWILLFKLEQEQKIANNLNTFKKILPPKDRFWADPHLIKKNNKYYIFIEELIYRENKGFISVIEMNQDGTYGNPTRIIEEDFHLSYPFVIESNEELYMIPESSKNNDIRLYRCTKFPDQWTLDSILMDNVEAVDTTVFFHNSKYWMFTNIVVNKGASSYDELFLFHADNLKSTNWISHPQNPVVSDVRSARPAGKVFTLNNNIYRPAQNCSKHYGYGMAINQIVKLTETEYEENVVDEILPNWEKNIVATHTLNSCDNLTVIDAIYKRSKF